MSHNPHLGHVPNHSHDLHVTPAFVGWKIIANEHSQPLAITRTRDEAVALAMRMEYEDPDCGDVLIHGPNGEIRERITIEHKHPFPPIRRSGST
jgi:hypothetical protein